MKGKWLGTNPIYSLDLIPIKPAFAPPPYFFTIKNSGETNLVPRFSSPESIPRNNRREDHSLNNIQAFPDFNAKATTAARRPEHILLPFLTVFRIPGPTAFWLPVLPRVSECPPVDFPGFSEPPRNGRNFSATPDRP